MTTNPQPEHQPRERAVRCPNHSPRRAVETWNVSGYCDNCERRGRGRRAVIGAAAVGLVLAGAVACTPPAPVAHLVCPHTPSSCHPFSTVR
jgi:hypothetical protein